MKTPQDQEKRRFQRAPEIQASAPVWFCTDETVTGVLFALNTRFRRFKCFKGRQNAVNVSDGEKRFDAIDNTGHREAPLGSLAGGVSVDDGTQAGRIDVGNSGKIQNHGLDRFFPDNRLEIEEGLNRKRTGELEHAGPGGAVLRINCEHLWCRGHWVQQHCNK